MNNLQYRMAVKNFVKKKFCGHKVLKSKYIPMYPYTVERQYIRTVWSFMGKVEKEIRKTLPKLIKYLKQRDIRLDADETPLNLEQIFDELEREVDNKVGAFELHRRLTLMANVTRKLSIAEWKKAVFKTLGVNILEDYYSGEFYGDIIPRWIETNVNKIVTIPHGMLGEMKTLTQKGFYEGRSIKKIIDDIQGKYEMTRRHARLIARDQTGKLYGQLTRSQHEDAGVNDYIWKGVMDNRERESHVDREGERYRYGELGESHEPGQEYQCRCVAVPIFDWDNLDLPMSSNQVEDREGFLYG